MAMQKKIISISAEANEQLIALSHSTGLSQAEVIRRALGIYLNLPDLPLGEDGKVDLPDVKGAIQAGYEIAKRKRSIDTQAR